MLLTRHGDAAVASDDDDDDDDPHNGDALLCSLMQHVEFVPDRLSHRGPRACY